MDMRRSHTIAASPKDKRRSLAAVLHHKSEIAQLAAPKPMLSQEAHLTGLSTNQDTSPRSSLTPSPSKKEEVEREQQIEHLRKKVDSLQDELDKLKKAKEDNTLKIADMTQQREQLLERKPVITEVKRRLSQFATLDKDVMEEARAALDTQRKEHKRNVGALLQALDEASDAELLWHNAQVTETHRLQYRLERCSRSCVEQANHCRDQLTAVGFQPLSIPRQSLAASSIAMSMRTIAKTPSPSALSVVNVGITALTKAESLPSQQHMQTPSPNDGSTDKTLLTFVDHSKEAIHCDDRAIHGYNTLQESFVREEDVAYERSSTIDAGHTSVCAHDDGFSEVKDVKSIHCT